MKVVITSTVMHDDKLLEVGDTPDLPAAVAKALVEAGAALEAGKKQPPADPPPAE